MDSKQDLRFSWIEAIHFRQKSEGVCFKKGLQQSAFPLSKANKVNALVSNTLWEWTCIWLNLRGARILTPKIFHIHFYKKY